MSFRVAPRADDDLSDIVDYIAEHNAPAAVRLVERMRGRFRLLALHPRSGQAHPDLGTEVRHVVVGSYIALYRVRPDHVEILRILHGRRDLSRLRDELD